MTTLIGHDEAWAQWTHAMASPRMHHAWLLAGKKGLGKATFAMQAARELLAAQSDADHPDIITLTYGPKNAEEAKKRDSGKSFAKARGIKVSQIRKAQQRLVTRPTLGDKRVIVIDPADDMETGASNALLKSLEEPPAGTFFLLIAHNPARLLPTIRSRCRVLRFSPLSKDKVLQVLSSAVPETDPAARTAAAAASSGSPGAALEYLEYGLQDVSQTMHRLVTAPNDEHRLRGKLAGVLSGKQDIGRMQALLSLARTVVADKLTHPTSDPAHAIDSHTALVRLSAECATANYDPGLLAMEIANLLVQAGAASGQGNV